MASIKRFFTKKKLDVKFKKAGSGHVLSSEEKTASAEAPLRQESQHARPASQSLTVVSQPQSATSESRRAGEAALGRLNKPRPAVSKVNSDIRSQARQQIDAEQAQIEDMRVSSDPRVVTNDAVPMAQVLFTCPDIGPAVLPKSEMDAYIKDFLMSQLEEEAEMTSAVMIQTLNKDREKVAACVDTVCKYLENIIANPGEEKFCKIKIDNRIFKEKVAPMTGAIEFLNAVGFQQKTFGVNDEDVEFLWLDSEHAILTERLVNIREILMAADPIRAQLDRAMRVFQTTTRGEQFQIPAEFYNITPEDLKKEQQIRQEAVEKMGMLRTKAMRDRDEMRELRRYRYTLIRIRFPDGILLQGTFKANDKMAALYDYVRECIVNDWLPFCLTMMTGKTLDVDSSQSLVELGMAPSCIINFTWDETVMRDIAATPGASVSNVYLKPELLLTIQSL